MVSLMTSLRNTIALSRNAPRIKGKDQGTVLIYLGELLNQGFTLSEALSFLSLMIPEIGPAVSIMENRVAKGEALSESLKKLSYNHSAVSQIALAQENGTFNETLTYVGQHLVQQRKTKTKLINIGLYPMGLVIFVLMMLMVMRSVLLPQMLQMLDAERLNWLMKSVIWFIEYLPQITVFTIFITLLATSLWQRYLKYLGPLSAIQLLVRIPLVGSFYRLYYSFYFARELGLLFQNGFQLNQIVPLLTLESNSVLVQAFGDELGLGLKKGHSLSIILRNLEIFEEIFPTIIYQAELTQKLGLKLEIYAKDCLTRLQINLEKLMGQIQPILFAFVAIVILLVYLIIMLPMFSSLEGVL